MNEVKCIVKKIVGKPKQVGTMWSIDVLANSWGAEIPMQILRSTKEKIDEIEVGTEFYS